MANLKTEYIDARDVKHDVEHLTVAEDGNPNREQLLEELYTALAKSDKRILA